MTTMKKCFVVMGFGEKPDLATGRTLDLDKTYRIIIRKAVEESGLECIRADDVIHSGIIDAPMYKLLLEADIVIADLSTANANAIYELGVRHALRPYTTIVIAEKQFKFPFDLSHLLIRPYEHLGKGIDAEEADRVRTDLKKAIETLLQKPDVDSPVYTFLPHLQVAASGAPAAESAALASAAAEEGASTTSELFELFQEAKAGGAWSVAVGILSKLRKRRPNDDYITQQLALATYKSKKPDVQAALIEAKQILKDLNPHTSTDPETLGLWGAVHKRLFDVGKEPASVDESIWAYEKGFYLKDDYYNGINLAFMLNVRASISAPREAFADVVQAERIRKRVGAICRRLIENGIKDDKGGIDQEETFWVHATLVEALNGSGQTGEASELRKMLAATAPHPWMVDSMNEQLGKLDALLAAAPKPLEFGAVP